MIFQLLASQAGIEWDIMRIQIRIGATSSLHAACTALQPNTSSHAQGPAVAEGDAVAGAVAGAAAVQSLPYQLRKASLDAPRSFARIASPKMAAGP